MNDAAAIAVFCIVAADVWHIREILRLMMRSNDPDSCTSSEVEKLQKSSGAAAAVHSVIHSQDIFLVTGPQQEEVLRSDCLP